jgi:hypothetical protein
VLTDDLLDQLYTAPPERFIAVRDDAVAAARKAGDRSTAEAIGKLRKPTVAAWLVNLLSRKRPELLGELLALGDALRTAQHDLRGSELRELSIRRRAAIGGLVGQVRQLAREAGRDGREALPLGEVEATLAAALAEPEVAEAVRAGTLTRATGYAGFGETPKPRLRVIDGGLKEKAGKDTAGKDTAGKDTAGKGKVNEEAHEAARTRAREAQAELHRATQAEQDAARVLAELTAQLEELRERQAQAQLDLRQARLRLKAAQRAAARTGA